jgi:hypothetical protein
MTDTVKDWVLPNGFTYIASTAGHYGTWAKATDPVTAARNASNYHGSSSYPHFISVWYGPSETTHVTEMGGLSYSSEYADKMVPVGFFEVRKNSIKPSKDKRCTHLEFVEEWLGYFDTAHQEWVKQQQKQ